MAHTGIKRGKVHVARDHRSNSVQCKTSELVQLRIWGGDGDDDTQTTTGATDSGGIRTSSTATAGTNTAGSGTSSGSDSGGIDSGPGDLDYAAKYEEERAKSVSLTKQINDANAALEKIQRSARSSEENMQRDLEKFKKIAEEYESFKKSTYLELQILKESKFKWHEKAIADVANSIDMDSIIFHEEGGKVTKIEGLENALKQVAKDKPYLMVSAREASNLNDNEKPDKASGAHPFGGTSGTGKAESDKDLMKKYKIA